MFRGAVFFCKNSLFFVSIHCICMCNIKKVVQIVNESRLFSSCFVFILAEIFAVVKKFFQLINTMVFLADSDSGFRFGHLDSNTLYTLSPG